MLKTEIQIVLKNIAELKPILKQQLLLPEQVEEEIEEEEEEIESVSSDSFVPNSS